MRPLAALAVLALACCVSAQNAQPTPASKPPHVVMLVGESEYGSERTMPAFAWRLERELSLRTTVLQSRERELPPLDVLDEADLLVLFLRFREADAAQLARLKKWFDDGRPCVALRTTSHAFAQEKGWFPPFFGGHYKAHAPNGQGTITSLAPTALDHPILRGVAPTIEMGHGGTYNAQPLADAATPLVFGRTGILPSEPVAWTFRYTPASRIVYTSLGSRENFEREDFQRLLANAVLWCLEREVPAVGALPGGAARAVPAMQAVPSAPPLAAPAGATVLFDGRDASAFVHYDPSVAPLSIGLDRRADSSSGGETYVDARWRVEDRALVARPGFGDLVTRESFGDYHLHLDVFVPEEPAAVSDAFRGRGGVYLAGRYEIEIAAVADQKRGNAAVLGQHAPLVAVPGEPGRWHALDVHFRQEQDRSPVLSAWWDGQQVHDRVILRERTPYGFVRPTPGSRSQEADGGDRAEALLQRTPAQSFDFGGGAFTVAARFRTKEGGTIVARAPGSGPWQPNAKALFLRGGKLVYDIGWVGAMQSEQRYDDGRWHRVMLTHAGGSATLFVDGELVAERAGFVAPDEPEHAFKIGAASPNFGGDYRGELSDVTVFTHNVSEDKARHWSRGEVVDLGAPALEWTPAPGTKAQGAVAEQVEPDARGRRPGVPSPIRLQADCSELRFANIWLQPLADVDHRGLIAHRDVAVLAEGQRVYAAVCASCHADPKASFAKGLQHGSDPRAIFEGLERGSATKPAMAWVPPRARYAAIHFLRRELGLPDVDADYLARQPVGLSVGNDAGAPVDEADWPPYRAMDYGDVLHWTYEVPGDRNIAQKGIAIRLDGGVGKGGVSRGRAFVVYDEDTMAVSAAWTGSGFVDWKGVAFDGSHNSHASIVGDAMFTNPVGPGWAKPGTTSFADERFVGRDGRRFGPTARTWLQYRGRRDVGGRVLLEYDVGGAPVRELPGFGDLFGTAVFTRTLDVAGCDHELWLRVAPATDGLSVHLDSAGRATELVRRDGFTLVRIASGAEPARFRVAVAAADARLLVLVEASMPFAEELAAMSAAPAARWEREVESSVRRGAEAAGDRQPRPIWTVDEFVLPDTSDNPWRSWLRLGGFDFFADGRRAAVSTWNGDVWIVTGVEQLDGELVWRRFATGLYQPLGVRIVDGVVFVACRDQIVVLEDHDGDGEADRYRCFNNDHQVTEHFHEFAMGLQTDADGNFYYAKSARHAKEALVPHHGTLLKVSADGATTDIVANGFRAANGVSVNGDGSFYVTDQEGHWTPKNRINRVVAGGFYGNMMGYHDRTSTADEDMEQPLCWITNAFDRSPAELVRVEGDRFGLPAGALLEVSYGMGQVFLVHEDEVDGVHQGSMVALPFGPFPTGVMRGRFHPGDGQLYCCGLYGWSGARTRPGGFYRVRYLGEPVAVPTHMRAVAGGLELTFGTALDPETANDPGSFGVKTWSLRRAASYGSQHHDEKALTVQQATLSADGRTVRLVIPELGPTMGLEVLVDAETADGRLVRATVHGSIHRMPVVR